MRHFLGGTIRAISKLRSYFNEEITDASHVVTIYDAAGSLVTTLTNQAVHLGSGIWSQDYTIPSTGYVAGLWRLIWVATVNVKSNKNMEYFEVIDATSG